jgi:hypothetical protein
MFIYINIQRSAFSALLLKLNDYTYILYSLTVIFYGMKCPILFYIFLKFYIYFFIFLPPCRVPRQPTIVYYPRLQPTYLETDGVSVVLVGAGSALQSGALPIDHLLSEIELPT